MSRKQPTWSAITFKPTFTQHLFITCRDTIVVLVGPQGEGKTFAGALALLHQAQKWKAVGAAPLRACIIRDTHENIKRMTVPSMQQVFSGLAEWSNEYRRMTLTDGSLICDLMGMEDEGSLSKLQGAEYAFIWLEEPAPIIDKANAGLSINVYNTALSRVARQMKVEHERLGLRPRLQVTMNPADEGHWTYMEFIESPRFPSPSYPGVTLSVFNIPYGENVHLSNIARATAAAAFSKDPALYARYVEGRWAYVPIGVSVTPEYNERFHRSTVPLVPFKGIPVWRGWDGGLNPTVVFVQIMPTGRIFVLDALVGENMGMLQFVRGMVKPLIAQRYSDFKDRTMWHDIGDPSLMNREASNSDHWAARIIEEELNTYFEPGEKAWPPRLEAVKTALGMMVGGEAALCIAPHEHVVHRALRGGWHYRTDSNGKVIRDIPIKNIHSHPADALSYVLARVLGVRGVVRTKKKAINRSSERRVSWRTA